MIFKKLRLKHARFINQLAHDDPITVGYAFHQGQRSSNLYDRPLCGSPSYGAYFTIEDLIKLFTGIDTYKLLSEESLKQLKSSYFKQTHDNILGLGPGTIEQGCFIQHLITSHQNGNIIALEAKDSYASIYIDWVMPHGYSAYVISNLGKGSSPLDNNSAESIIGQIRRLVLNQ
jgi:hypothetical protein